MRFRFLLVLFVYSSMAYSQKEAMSKNAFLQRDVQTAFEFWNTTQPSTEFHSSFRPYLSSTFLEARDSLLPFKSYGFQNTFLQRSLNKSTISKTKHSLQFHPLLDAEVGFDALENQVMRSVTAGIHAKYNINHNFTFALVSPLRSHYYY